ncbi:hypothetical protein I5M27_00895 [Adhaeribacter sp. BT258]|uniref:Fibronectin type-III domain-containing protein n=1 Tax=Adhaeribacter terrigena TaxID=2793070 RepID=A0ABS1BWL2_9BACT|nr:hypothetical protein [Adhaeribacter terrigena]MBK0401518.1 hypothetical protein [Adhaeribacter terrigena]
MARIFTLILICFAFTATFADELGVSLNFFRAGFEGTDVKVEWEIANENGVSGYEVYRKLNNETTFKQIGSGKVTGVRRYSLLDTDLRNVPNRIGTITYKLTVATSTGDASFTTAFVNNPSSVERSWGSIKSMFR